MHIRKTAVTSFLLLTSVVAMAQTALLDPSSSDIVAAKSTTRPSAVSFSKEGLIFSNQEKSDTLRVHGYVQADGRFFSSDLKSQSPDQLLWRRIRPEFEGTLFNRLDFRFMPDFGQNNPQVQEVWVEAKMLSFLKPRIGKFKTPLGLEALRSDQQGTFVERSLASDLVPHREVGVQVGGSVLGNSLMYAIGYFNGAPDGSDGNFQWRTSNEGVARVFLQPFATTSIIPLQGLGVGFAGSAAYEHGTLPSFKTVGQNSFFKYNKVLADGQHNRITPQAYYFAGPLGVLTEYTKSSQEVLGNHGLTYRLANEGWQATASLVITGEKNTYQGIRPKYDFEPNRGFKHLGAWELAGRLDQLRVDHDAFPLFADPKKSAQAASEWSVGINWYPSRFVKIMNDYAHTSFAMASQTAKALHSENVILSCIQLAF